jgi:VanZ family protein
VVSLGPFPQPDFPGPLELLPHILAYGAATVIALALTHRDRSGVATAGIRWWTVALVAAAMMAFGVVLEGAQRVVRRDVEVADVVANAIGVVTAVVVWSVWRRSRRNDG